MSKKAPAKNRAKAQLLLPKPKLLSIAVGTSEELLCPCCGFQGNIQDFDVLGADDGCLFCNQCGEEVEL